MMNKLCCFRLNTAAIVIGWLGCVGSVTALAIASVALSKIDVLTDFLWQHMKLDATFDITETQLHAWLTIIAVVYLVASSISLVTSSLLILGTVKERHLLLLPWLINSGIYLVMTIIYYGGMTIMQIASGQNFASTLFFIIICSAIVGIHFIIWYAMYSHYKQIQAARDQQQQLLPRTTATSYPSYVKM